jgi:predicted transcriptional regulator
MASIQRSLDDIAAGRVQTLEEVDEEIRREFGFKPRAK